MAIMGQNLRPCGFFWATALLLLCLELLNISILVTAFSVSSFHGNSVSDERITSSHRSSSSYRIANLTMRKQKASDRRTRRMQRGHDSNADLSEVARSLGSTLTSSPMARAQWTHKKVTTAASSMRKERNTGRGRSRKRTNLYNSLSSYHSHFLSLLTTEYQAEEDEILGRIKASAEDPLGLEAAGHALFDLYPERRGDLYSDEVYRLTKAKDATTFAGEVQHTSLDSARELPPNHKFSSNDVILLTLQPGGSGDFFEQTSLPTNSMAVSVEARVLGTGPSYIDVALLGGSFEAAFGPAPNNGSPSGKGDPRMRLRADRFFSNVPYTRMVAAVSQLTSIPEKTKQSSVGNPEKEKDARPHDRICMDELLRDTILSTFALNDPSSTYFRDMDACNLRDLANSLARPPLPNSPKLAKQALSYIQSNPYGTFSPFNGPQLTAIEAALTRRLTLIQGPPGTGKTTVASAIGFGFVHQCRNISPHAKVLACAFSNVGADNLAEQLVRVGLKVVRIGKPSAVSESLWEFTLDAAIDQDPDAQKALRNAAWATSQLAKPPSNRKGSSRDHSAVLSERSKRDVATAAVKASIEACNVAATRTLREADVIVSTSTGAFDTRLLAACGIATGDDILEQDGRLKSSKPGARTKVKESDNTRQAAPDDLPPLSLPFVIVDEACQSVEPATLIPMTATNSCRSLVLLGDPCQLPPTVKTSSSSPLSVSLMERLAATLPQPVIVTGQADHTERDERFLQSKSTKQARSLLRRMDDDDRQRSSYRKRFSGALLLSVQYRMHPSISAFSSAIFYDGLLATPSFLGSHRRFPQALVDTPSEDNGVGVRFIDVGGRSNERRGGRGKFPRTVFSAATSGGEETSYSNQGEATKVLDLIKNMLGKRGINGDPETLTIGVVTPYTGQVELIKSIMSLDEEFQELVSKLTEPVEVKSVDGYQGREREVIIFSTVRSNRHGKVGFLSDWRRMNVALTRARRALIVVGDLATLAEGDRHWAAFEKWCRGMNCVVNYEKADARVGPLDQ